LILDRTKMFDAEYDTWILLSRVYRMIANLRRIELSKYEILPVQAYILLVIYKLGNDISPSELSRYVYQQKSTVSDILTRMEKQGLIKKSPASDGRSRISIKLTEKGDKVLKLSSEREYLHRIMSYLTPQKTRELISCLEILRDNAMNQMVLHEKKKLPPSAVSKCFQKKDLFEEDIP
jgi:DNA-binding MarR family transcriptional regulator